MNDTDLKVADAMMLYGGSFVQALGRAAMVADAGNLERLKLAFPDYWLKYADHHIHCCQTCHRPFYLCTERDCMMVPKSCLACEQDHLDLALTQPTLPLTHKGHRHEN